MASFLSFGIVLLSFTSSLIEAQQRQGEFVKFKLSAVNLPNSDLDGPSDPYVMLYSSVLHNNVFRYWDRFGITPALKDTLNPEWDVVFTFQYFKGISQRWRFFVMDKDDSWLNPVDDHLGRIELGVDEYINQLNTLRANGSENIPIQLFLSEPAGGALLVTPVQE